MTVPGSSAPTAAARTAVVWCPDWAVTAARHAEVVPVGTAVVVVARGTRGVTVQAASPEARAAGITVGIRRREAEGLCPDLTVIDDDPMRNGRAFEAVARAVEGFTPRLVLERPGRLSFPTRGPSRYFGGDDTLAALVIVALDEHGFDTARLGIADGLFAAGLAARAGGHARVRIVAPGESAAFLAPLPVGVLGDPELASVLSRLGLRTLAAFHALPAPDVLARFGRDGFDAYQRAAGLDDEPVTLTIPPAELTVMHEFDPPEPRVDAAAFAAKALADEFLARLTARGLACTRVIIEAETEHEEMHTRTWRHDGALSAAALVDRARWQLDAWIGAVRDAPTGGLWRLRFIPDQLTGAPAYQLGLWGGDQVRHDRAQRTLARVQAMLGHDHVVTAVANGGRTPREQVRWVPWGEPRDVVPPGPARWPGAVPPPYPTRVFDPPIPVEFVDATGAPVRVSGRGEASAAPARVIWSALPPGAGSVTGWAGPWAYDVRWWDPRAHSRRTVWQLLLDADVNDRRELACLVTVERGRAGIEAIYD